MKGFFLPFLQFCSMYFKQMKVITVIVYFLSRYLMIGKTSLTENIPMKQGSPNAHFISSVSPNQLK